MKQSARSTAFHVLKRVYGDGAYTNVALQHALKESALSARDKSLCTEIVYGTVRRQITIDTLLQGYVKRKLRDLDSDVLTILRMSLYQLAFLSRVPAYAVIDEAVELGKRHVRRASGLINGVLRSYTRNHASVEEQLRDSLKRKAADPVLWLSVLHGYPTWMVKRLVDRYGMDKAEQVFAAGNEAAPLTVRTNPLKGTVDTIEAMLKEAVPDINLAHGVLSPQALRIHSGVDVEQLSLYQQGYVTLQDEGAMLIAPLVEPLQNRNILDMCAAPGGKTTHIAELQRDEGHIVAYDVYLGKVKNIQSASARLGVNSITARLSDARMLADAGDVYDAVLLDAPCSGLGVMRRRPDIRHRRTEQDVVNLASLQRELLMAASHCVRSGGVIVYSTCTLLPDENEDIIHWFLSETGHQFVLDDISNDLPEVCRSDVADGLLLTPDRFDTDGFYMARLRKK